MPDRPLVVLKTFDTLSEAELYRNELLARHIPADVAGPDTSGTFGAYFVPMSRVSVVATEEAARRLARLEKAEPSGSIPKRPAVCRSRQPFTPMHFPRRPGARTDA
jgi:hypothetical protein